MVARKKTIQCSQLHSGELKLWHIVSVHDGNHNVDRISVDTWCQYMTAITIWTESLWAFPESYSAGNSQIVYSNNSGQREEKRAQNLTIRVSFCAIIIHWVSADSNTDSVVRIFIGLSCKLWGFTIYVIAFYYGAQFSPTRSVTITCPWQSVYAHEIKKHLTSK